MLNFPDGMNKAVILKGEKTRKDTRKDAKRHPKRHNTMRIDTNKSRSNVLLVSFLCEVQSSVLILVVKKVSIPILVYFFLLTDS